MRVVMCDSSVTLINGNTSGREGIFETKTGTQPLWLSPCFIWSGRQDLNLRPIYEEHQIESVPDGYKMG